MTPLTAEEIAELRRLEYLVGGVTHIDFNHPGPVATLAAEWTTAARNALPRLLDEVERSRALLKRVDDGITDTWGDHGPEGTPGPIVVGVRVELDRDAYLELKALLGHDAQR